MAGVTMCRFYDRDVSAALNIRRCAVGPGPRPTELCYWEGRPAMPKPGQPGQEWVYLRDKVLLRLGFAGAIAALVIFLCSAYFLRNSIQRWQQQRYAASRGAGPHPDPEAPDAAADQPRSRQQQQQVFSAINRWADAEAAAQLLSHPIPLMSRVGVIVLLPGGACTQGSTCVGLWEEPGRQPDPRMDSSREGGEGGSERGSERGSAAHSPSHPGRSGGSGGPPEAPAAHSPGPVPEQPQAGSAASASGAGRGPPELELEPLGPGARGGGTASTGLAVLLAEAHVALLKGSESAASGIPCLPPVSN
ncbi:hypothetical protein QJQ45_024156, partial [Haematococcus lacustris]